MKRATTSTIEDRIAKMSRHSAKIVMELRAEGDPAGAERFAAVAMQLAEDMRRDARRGNGR